MTSTQKFTGNFTQQEPIPEDAIERAVEVMRSGRLHRYNVASDADISETAQLEIEFAQYQQQRFCLAMASGGYAIQTALRALGLKPGQSVMTNAFTLSPVPGAIDAVGGKPLLIETTDDLVLDLQHLQSVIENTQSKVLLLSHMRGHIVDMHALCDLCKEHDVTIIEDCAHTMGASFDGAKSGTHGALACFSTQTYKHINSGEGGFIASNNEELMAKCIVLSGSYMLYERHKAAPAASVIDSIKLQTPNCSGRMDNLRAAILRTQLQQLDTNCQRWNKRYKTIMERLSNSNSIKLPKPHPLAVEVSSSFQFSIPAFNDEQNAAFLKRCLDRGVELKWFGAMDPVGYTSRYESWQYVESTSLTQTNEVLRRLYDCRIPLTFSVEDCALIADIIVEESNRY